MILAGAAAWLLGVAEVTFPTRLARLESQKAPEMRRDGVHARHPNPSRTAMGSRSEGAQCVLPSHGDQRASLL